MSNFSLRNRHEKEITETMTSMFDFYERQKREEIASPQYYTNGRRKQHLEHLRQYKKRLVELIENVT